MKASRASCEVGFSSAAQRLYLQPAHTRWLGPSEVPPEHEFIPVLHVDESEAAAHAPDQAAAQQAGKWYYYASGCSDLYIRSPTMSRVSANNRVAISIQLTAKVHGCFLDEVQRCV